MEQKNRSQRKLPGGSPPVVTYSRLREEELPDIYDDERAAPAFEDESVAEWEAVEVPPEPPLHARRRARPLVEEVRAPVDPDRFPDERLDDERPPSRARPKRSTAMRLVSVAAAAAVILGIGILAYSFTATTAVPVRAPTLSEGGTAADDGLADGAASVREIPLDNAGGTEDGAAPPQAASAEAEASEPVNTVPVAPPPPRPRPEPPTATATIQPDFDQAAPLPAASPAATPLPMPPAAAAPAGGIDDDFIASIERTLQQSRGAAEPPPLSPTAQPIQLAPPPAPTVQQGFGQPQEFPGAIQSLPPQQGALVPPEDIPMLDGQSQPIQLPNDYLFDTD